MAEYNIVQKVFALSMLSNIGSSKTGTPQELQTGLAAAITQALANPVIQGVIGEWKAVWGPFIYQDAPSKSEYVDNALMVFQQGQTFVVAVAATNPMSSYDWVQEDFAVHETVPWPNPGAPKGVWISAATNTGLTNLVNMPYAYGTTGPSLGTFLSDLSDKGSKTLIFTGHSLGGALSPTLATYLCGAGGVLNGAGWKDVLVLPTAGASPGNEAFATFYGQTFAAKASGYKAPWNALLRNTIDIVPHAWATASLAQVPTLYGPAIQWSYDVAALAILWAGFSYVLLPAETFTGKQTGAVTDWSEFAREAGVQHTTAYFDYFGIPVSIIAADGSENTVFRDIAETMAEGVGKGLDMRLEFLRTQARNRLAQ